MKTECDVGADHVTVCRRALKKLPVLAAMFLGANVRWSETDLLFNSGKPARGPVTDTELA